MPQNADADDGITTMRIHRKTLRRLDARSGDEDASYEDVVQRLLDETEQEISLDEALRTVRDQFDEVACMYVNHPPSIKDRVPSQFDIWVYTGEAETMEDVVEVFGPEYKISIEMDGERVRVPFTVYASYSGPKSLDSAEGTPIYMAESVVNAPRLPFEVGLDYLKDKLNRSGDWEPFRKEQTIPAINNEYEDSE